MADDLGGWLRKNFSHPEIAFWLPRYIKLRGTRRLGDMPGLSPSMKRVAASQDLIPWKDFMEGKISREWFLLQSPSLSCSPSRLNIADWSKRVISQILQMSHAQCIYRNASLHDGRVGHLATARREEILVEIDRLASLDPADVPESSRYLLEIDFSTVGDMTLERQSYWMLAMRAAAERRRGAEGAAARRAAARAALRRRQRCTRTPATPYLRIMGGGWVNRGSATLPRGVGARPRADTAAEEVWQSILVDMGVGGAEPRRRGASMAAAMGRRADNKRRRPD